MKEVYNRKLLNSFETYLYHNFEAYCEKYGEENDCKNFITYLIDKDFLNPAKIKRYTILNEFEARYPQHNYHKSKTVETLAALFDLSSRHVWSLVKYGEQLKNDDK